MKKTRGLTATCNKNCRHCVSRCVTIRHKTYSYADKLVKVVAWYEYCLKTCSSVKSTPKNLNAL